MTAKAGERGSVTLWTLGLVLVVFVLGGIGVDLWRGLAAHRQVAGVVDAAAVAAGSGIDEPAWRATGALRLDPDSVAGRVEAVVSGHDVEVSVTVAPDGSAATVRGSTTVDLTLLRLVATEPLHVDAVAVATPLLSP